MNSYLIKNFQTGVPLSQPMALDHLRLIVYGQAYIETIKLNKNDNYKIFSVEEHSWINDKAEMTMFQVKITLIKEEFDA